MKTKIIFTLLITAALVTFNSCRHNPVSPSQPQPGRRDYTWTVDTLYSPVNDLQSIWGSSPSNVWTTGPGGTMKDRLFHFDGKKWSNYEVPPGCAINVLFGFGSSNLWMGGNDGIIWHYDGNSITKNFEYQPKGWRLIEITDIWGRSAKDIYAVGVVFYDPQKFQRGFILHNDGLTWQKIYEANFYSSFLKVRGEDEKIYINDINSSYDINPDTVKFYELNKDSLKEIYSNTLDNVTFAQIENIGDQLYFLISQNIYKYQNGSFVKQLSFDEPEFGYQIYGRNMEDIFIRMRDGLAHYNGSDVKYLYKFSNNYTSINNVPAIFNNEIFFCVWDPINNVNFVLRGNLK